MLLVPNFIGKESVCFFSSLKSGCWIDVLPSDNFCWIGTDIYWSFRYMSIMPSRVFHSPQLGNLPNYQGHLELSGQTQSPWYLGPWTVLGAFGLWNLRLISMFFSKSYISPDFFFTYSDKFSNRKFVTISKKKINQHYNVGWHSY